MVRRTIPVAASSDGRRAHERTIDAPSPAASPASMAGLPGQAPDPFGDTPFDTSQYDAAAAAMRTQVQQKLADLLPPHVGAVVTVDPEDTPPVRSMLVANGGDVLNGAWLTNEDRAAIRRFEDAVSQVDPAWFDGDNDTIFISQSGPDRPKVQPMRQRLPDGPFTSDDELAEWMNHQDDEGGWAGLGADWNAEAYNVAVAFDKPVKDPVHLIAYHMRSEGAMGPDGFDGDVQGTPVGSIDSDGRARVWRYPCDLTKSRRSDRYEAMEALPATLANGSPVRTTNRAGVGTMGTRAVEGIGQTPRVAFR